MSGSGPLGGPDAEAVESFVGKWRARWPEWSVASVFVPEQQRRVAEAWASLLQELGDAAWSGTDARPGEIKLAWWQDELEGWGQGRRRHPLGLVLQPRPAAWAALAAALPAFGESRLRPRDPEHAAAQLAGAAQAAAEVEMRLLGDAARADPDQIAAALLAGWQHARLLEQGEAAVPLSLLARRGDAPAVPDWRAALRRNWPAPPAGAAARRIWSALARQRLHGPEERALPPLRTLWIAWRAASGA